MSFAMPSRIRPRVPSYRLHKTSDRAVVRLNGRDIYLGKYGTDDSKAKYSRVIAKWLSTQGRVASDEPPVAKADVIIAEVVRDYLRFSEQYYRKNGEPTSEVLSIRRALTPLVVMYGQTEVRDFGPLALKAYQEELIRKDLSRGVVNNHTGRVKRMFKWATANELTPAAIFHALVTVGGLRKGRSLARETAAVRPVDERLIEGTLKHVNRHVGAMIRLQRFTGMRPGEVTTMRGCDIETDGRVWCYTPESHKTEHHGRKRVIYLGPRAQLVLKPFLPKQGTDYLFCPATVMAEMRAEMRANRNGFGSYRRKVRRPKKLLGDYYTVSSYGHSIHRGTDKAFPPPEELSGEEKRTWRKRHRWTPHQLRHNAATFLRKEFGIEAARVILGHSSAGITEVYAELDFGKAADIMAQVG